MGKKSGRITLLTSLATTSALCLAATGVWAQSITVGTVNGSPGETVSVPVTIQVPASITEGVAGTQNDITFDPVNAPIGTVCLLDNTVKCTTDQDCITASGDSTDKCNVPDCTANTTIKKESTQFAFQPPNCTPGPTGCTGMRSLVFSQTAAQANRPIPDGSTLYTCNVKVASAATGSLPLTISNVVMSKPANSGCGTACAITTATGVNGAINVGGTPGPTTPGVTTTPGTTTPGTTTPGTTTPGTTTPGTTTPGTTTPGTTTPGTRTPATTTPATGTPKATGTATLGASPTPAVFTVNVGPAAAGATTLTILGTVPAGFPTSGTITTIGGTPVAIPFTRNGNTLTLSSGIPTALTAASTPVTAIAVSGGGGINTEDSDGCQIGAVGGGSAWLLLIPAIGLLAVRRRKH